MTWSADGCPERCPGPGERSRCSERGWGFDTRTTQDDRAEPQEFSGSWEVIDLIPIILKQRETYRLYKEMMAL